MNERPTTRRLSTASSRRRGKADSHVKRAQHNGYSWPPPVDPDYVYVPKQRNPIHSILTALPIIMLVTGLYFYYQNESEQSSNAPIRQESVEVSGLFTGLSVVKSGSQGRHYLWIDDNGTARGARIQPEQAKQLQTLLRGEPVKVKMAPTVHASKTYWAWYVEQLDEVVLDAEESLQ